MPSCVFRYCTNNSTNTAKCKGITFHRFPNDPHIKKKWIEATGRKKWLPTINSRICSIHFHEDTFIGSSKFRRVINTAYPTIDVLIISNDGKVRDQPAPAQPLPGPSNVPSTKTSGNNASSDQDPLSKGTIEQCRFCGEFSKECVSVCNMPYLSTNRTTLAFNDVIVQIDFNDHTLPKTICKDCDAKLQDMFDFVRVVKNAQRSLINVAEQDKVEVNVEVDPSAIETVVVKTECDDSDDEGDSSHDGNEDKDDSSDDNHNDDKDSDDDGNEEDDSIDDKDGIVDSLTISETVFIKEPVAIKRKNTTSAKNSKKAKVADEKSEEDSFIIDIKEEVIEKDTNDGNNTGYSDTGTDDKPSEVELATSALVFEMRGDGGFS